MFTDLRMPLCALIIRNKEVGPKARRRIAVGGQIETHPDET